MSTTPRLPSAIAGVGSDFRSTLAHAPKVLETFWSVYSTMWSTGDVDHVTRELVRLRNARVTDCGYCRNVRFSVAREQGLDEDMADLVQDGHGGAPLDDRRRAALAMADAFLFATPRPAEVDTAFDAGERAELALSLSLFLGMAKVLISLGLEPDAMSTTVVPTPGSLVG